MKLEISFSRDFLRLKFKKQKALPKNVSARSTRTLIHLKTTPTPGNVFGSAIVTECGKICAKKPKVPHKPNIRQ